jgi:hypothetical protein
MSPDLPHAYRIAADAMIVDNPRKPRKVVLITRKNPTLHLLLDVGSPRIEGRLCLWLARDEGLDLGEIKRGALINVFKVNGAMDSPTIACSSINSGRFNPLPLPNCRRKIDAK